MTNRKRFDNLSNAELAKILVKEEWCDGCEGGALKICSTEECVELVRMWLERKCKDNPPADNEPQQEAPAERTPDKTMINDVTTDNVNHPSHYNRDGAMECIREMVVVFGYEATINFCKLNAWKYRYRASEKNGAEDMAKSDWYVKKSEELKSEVGYF